MPKGKKRVRADSGGIYEEVFALPKPQPAPPAQYITFKPSPATSQPWSKETEGSKETEDLETGENDMIPQTEAEVNDKTRVSSSFRFKFLVFGY